MNERFSNSVADRHLRAFGSQVASAAEMLQGVPLLARCARELAEIGFDACAPCRIAVAGGFDAGKSTLLNALLGRQILKTSVLPANAAVVALEYSEEPLLVGHRHDGATVRLDPNRFDELVFQGEAASDGGRKSFTHFSFGVAHPLLKSFVLVDTPGLGALHGFHEYATRSFLHRTDALIWVTPLNQAGSATELRAVAEIGKPIDLLVVNRMDLLDPEEEQETGQALERIARRFSHPREATVGISARLAFEGRVQSRQDLLTTGNWSAFEQVLNRVVLSKVAHSKHRTIAVGACSAFNSLGEALNHTASELQEECDEVTRIWDQEIRLRASLLPELRSWSRSFSGTADRVLRAKCQYLSASLKAEIENVIQELGDSRDQHSKLRSQRAEEEQRKPEFESRQESIRSRRRAYEDMSFFDRLADRLFGDTKECIEQDETNLRQDRNRWNRRKRDLDDELSTVGNRITALEQDAEQLLERARGELRSSVEGNRQTLALLRRRRRVGRLRVAYRSSLMRAASRVLEQLGQLDRSATLAFGDLEELDGLLQAMNGCYAGCQVLTEMRPAHRSEKLIRACEAVLVSRIQSHASERWHSAGEVLELIENGQSDMPLEALAANLDRLAEQTDTAPLRLAASLSLLRLHSDHSDDPAIGETVGLLMGAWPSSQQEYERVLSIIPETATDTRNRLLHAGVCADAKIARFVLKSASRPSIAYHKALITVSRNVLSQLSQAN